jgi:hypothetical protein
VKAGTTNEVQNEDPSLLGCKTVKQCPIFQRITEPPSSETSSLVGLLRTED